VPCPMNSPPMTTRAASVPTLMCALQPPAGVPRASLYQAPDPRTTKVTGGYRARGNRNPPQRPSVDPPRPGSFDCSGLVQWAYKQAGVSVPRTSQGQAGVGTPVAQQDRQPGGIVAFYGGGHVGIYAGKGNVVHAPTTAARQGRPDAVHGFHHRATRLTRRRSEAEQSVDVVRSPPQAGTPSPRPAPLVPVRRPTGGGGSGVDQGGEDHGVGFVVLGFFVEGSPAGDQT